MRIFIFLAAVLAAVPAWPARVGVDDLDCEEHDGEVWGPNATACTAVEPASGAPQCAYSGSGKPEADTREAFGKLALRSGVPGVRLIYRDDPRKHKNDCSGGGAAAMPGGKKGKVPPRVYVCANAFLSIRNVHQLAATIGHELAHLARRHVEDAVKFELKEFRAWAKAQPKAFWAKPEQAQIDAAHEALCPRFNELSRRMEHEADDDGLNLAKNAGYDAKEGALFHVYDKDLSWATAKLLEADTSSTHPTDTERIEHSGKTAEELSR